MEHLPMTDPAMLMSAINFLLRDEIYENLDQICKAFNVKKEDIEKKLAEAGLEYNEGLNKVW